jgi:hypothetical protein
MSRLLRPSFRSMSGTACLSRVTFPIMDVVGSSKLGGADTNNWCYFQ